MIAYLEKCKVDMELQNWLNGRPVILASERLRQKNPKSRASWNTEWVKASMSNLVRTCLRIKSEKSSCHIQWQSTCLTCIRPWVQLPVLEGGRDTYTENYFLQKYKFGELNVLLSHYRLFDLKLKFTSYSPVDTSKAELDLVTVHEDTCFKSAVSVAPPG